MPIIRLTTGQSPITHTGNRDSFNDNPAPLTDMPAIGESIDIGESISFKATGLSTGEILFKNYVFQIDISRDNGGYYAKYEYGSSHSLGSGHSIQGAIRSLYQMTFKQKMPFDLMRMMTKVPDKTAGLIGS